MDYVDFIVHVFSAEKRAFYGLERLRKSATTISVADLNAEFKAALSAKRPKGTVQPARKNTARSKRFNSAVKKSATKKTVKQTGAAAKRARGTKRSKPSSKK
jgi:ribosome-associated protein